LSSEGKSNCRQSVDQTQRQDGEPVGEACRIQRQGHPRARPVLEDPGQQQCKTGGDVEFAAVRSRLLGSRLVPFAEPLADGVGAPADQGTEDVGDRRQRAGSSQHDAEAPESQDGRLRLAQMWEPSSDPVGPVVRVDRGETSRRSFTTKKGPLPFLVMKPRCFANWFRIMGLSRKQSKKPTPLSPV
jgi:hypothetical protein